MLLDGCIDLLWMDGALHVAGPDTAAFVTTVTGPVVEVRFRPGAAPAVLGVSAHALRDRRVPLGEVWPDAATLAARIADSAVGVLTGAVARRLAAPIPPYPPWWRRCAAAPRWRRAPGTPTSSTSRARCGRWLE